MKFHVIYPQTPIPAQSPIRLVEQATGQEVGWPALMQLMGHADIQTTLRYVQVTPQDVYLQYARAVAQRLHPVPRMSS